MITVVVLYPKPADPVHFERHFREIHLPLAKKLPGMRGFSFGPTKSLDGGDASFFWMVSSRFDSLNALDQALSSPEGQAAAADIPNYSKDAPTIFVVEATDG